MKTIIFFMITIVSISPTFSSQDNIKNNEKMTSSELIRHANEAMEEKQLEIEKKKQEYKEKYGLDI